MNEPKILIVDDETEIRVNLNKFLSRNLACEIQEASNGRLALEALKKDIFDLLLLDIKMPGISGIDVLKVVKETYPETDVIVISAWDSQSIATQAIKAGAQDYISKPSTINVIYDKVCEILKKRNKFLPKNLLPDTKTPND